jgi:hypothetical protein
MKLSIKTALLGALLLVVSAFPAFGQAALSQIGPNFYSAQFNSWRIPIDVGTAASGAGTLTLYTGMVALPDGRTFSPLSVNARINVNDGANSEAGLTVTAASGCGIGQLADSCQITATFANVHGRGATITSGSSGLDEAASAANSFGGGVVILDGSFGGTTATITAAPWLAAFPKVIIGDQRTGAFSYWRAAPGLTAIAAPAALTATTITTAITGGSIATATTPRFTVTAVDFFGGETAASADAAAAATLVDGAGSTNSYTITAAGVPVGTGIVGYRLYVSASGGATQTETLATTANMTCTAAPLSPLPNTCATNSAIILTSLPATTNAGPPQGTSGAATSLASAHTTVIAQNVGQMPVMLPFTNVAAAGFFPVTVTSATTLAAGFDVMGELQYPAGFFNTVGATYRVCGGGVTTPSAATVAGTWTLRIGPRQNSAGTSGSQVAVPFGFVASNQWTAAASHFDFCTDITTTTSGASGVVEGSASSFSVVVAAGNDGAGTSTTVGAFNAASTATDLTQQGVLQLTYVQTAASWTVPQLRYLSITRL